jgi:subtilisin family serine protease
VAVVDTGIDPTQPDLVVGAGTSCVNGDPSLADPNGHGTFVAGIIGARNNGSGVVGVAPGTVLHPVKVLDATGSGTLSQVVCGLDWVAHRAHSLRIRVANLSFAATGGSAGACGPKQRDALRRAICSLVARGVTVVAAAGNAPGPISAQIPAAYPEVLTVTAMADGDGEPGGQAAAPCDGVYADDTASGSSFGVTSDDRDHILAAPGVCIRSTLPGGGLGVDSGTSAAAPHVSGTIALCYGTDARPGPCWDLTPAAIVHRLIADAAAQPSDFGFSGDARTGSPDRYYGYLVYAGAF